MKAITLKDFGDVDNLQMQQLPEPEIKDDEVLVQVKAISINPVDAKTRAGKGLATKLKDDKPIILGWDIAGIVAKVGKDVKTFRKDDEVFGMINFPGHGKAYAEYVAAPAAQIVDKPKNISFEEAAAGTLAALTAWEAVVDNLKIKNGDRVLIHAAAGGVGHFAVQLAKHYGGYIIGTASSENKDFVLSLGADECLDYKAQPLEDVIKDVDKVLDTIGGDNIDLSLKLMKQGGTILSIPSGKNDKVEEKAVAKGMKGLAMMVKSSGENQKQIALLMGDGILKAHVSKTFSLEQMKEAHEQIESGKTVGKIIVKL